MEEMSYNLYLYKKRQETGLSIRKFAKLLHLSYWRYNLTEKGYFKPNKKVIDNVSKEFGIDYSIYCDGYSSYPSELPYVRKNKLINKAYDIIGSLAFKIVMGVLIVLGIGNVTAAGIIQNYYNDNSSKGVSETIVNLRDYIYENGSISFSLTDTFIQKEIYKKSEDSLYIIKIDNKKDDYTNFYIYGHVWSEEGHVTYDFGGYRPSGYELKASITSYKTNEYYTASIIVNKDNDEVTLETSNNASPEVIENLVKADALNFDENIHDVILENTGMDIDVRNELFKELKGKKKKKTLYNFLSLTLFLTGIVLGLGSVFGLFFSFIYGTKKGIGIEFENRSGYQIPDNEEALKKKDIKASPFIPETFLEIIGILFVFISTLRIVIAVLYAVGESTLSINDFKMINNSFMNFFYFGMFLLYFIDFDLFLDDRRVFRNVVLYFLIYIGLYVIEASVMTSLKGSQSVLLTLFTNARIPNMFGSICMYFLIMLFLFFTPKFVNTKKRLIIYRSLSIIPVIVIVAFTIIYNGANKYFNWNLDFWGLYIFNSERFPFSILCIAYLFSLFFLRLIFENRMGSEKAARFFNSNKFLWLKNIMTCLIILAVALVELSLTNNPVAKDFGLGHHFNLIWLIPLVLFYHPHKGPRNKFVDWFTLGLYGLSIVAVYIFLAIPLIVSLFQTA